MNLLWYVRIGSDRFIDNEPKQNAIQSEVLISHRCNHTPKIYIDLIYRPLCPDDGFRTVLIELSRQLKSRPPMQTLKFSILSYYCPLQKTHRKLSKTTQNSCPHTLTGMTYILLRSGAITLKYSSEIESRYWVAICHPSDGDAIMKKSYLNNFSENVALPFRILKLELL